MTRWCAGLDVHNRRSKLVVDDTEEHVRAEECGGEDAGWLAERVALRSTMRIKRIDRLAARG